MKKTTYIGPIVLLVTIITAIVLLILTSCENSSQRENIDISFVPDTAMTEDERTLEIMKMIKEPHIIMPAENEPIMVEQIPYWEPLEMAFYKTKEAVFTYNSPDIMITVYVHKYKGQLVEDRKEFK